MLRNFLPKKFLLYGLFVLFFLSLPNSLAAAGPISISSLVNAYRNYVAPTPPSVSPLIIQGQGVRGPQGIQGPRGLTGPMGPMGPMGPAGISNLDSSLFVSRDLFHRQVDRIYDSIADNIEDLRDSLGEEVNTESLNVSGNATIGGNLTVTGTITGNVSGTINPNFTPGSVIFQGPSGLEEDNSNFFWDDTNDRLGIGTATPSQTLQIGSTANRIFFFDATLGVASIGQAGNTVGILSINRSIDDPLIQYALNVLPNWNVPGLSNEMTGVQITPNMSANVHKQVGAGIAVEVPFMNPSAIIDNWFSAIFRGSHGAAGTISSGVTLSVETSNTQTLWVATDAANPITAAAGIAFGSTRDTNLYRGATSSLTTDGSLRISGSLGVSSNHDVTAAIKIGGNAPTSSGISRVIYIAPTIPANTTVSASMLASTPITTASVFTLSNLYHINIGNVTIGSGSTVTSQYGLYIAPLTTGSFNIGAAIGKASTQTLWLSNAADDTTAAGGIAFGVSRDTAIYRAGVADFRTTGHHTFTTDNIYDIGASGATRPRTGYFGTSMFAPLINGDTAANGDITINGTSSATKTTSYVILQDTGGNVGIGTTAPATALDVAGALSMREMAAPAVSPLDQGRIYFDATANKFKVSENNGAYVDLVGGSSSQWVNGTAGAIYYNGGNVGIGTADPTALLHISTSTTAVGLTKFEQASTDADGYDLNFLKSRGTVASPVVVVAADELGVINFRGYSGASGYVTAAAIKALVPAATIGNTQVPGALTFWTGTSAAPTVLTERMRINNTGLVGIGNTNPSFALEIGDGTSNVLAQIRLNDASNNQKITFSNSSLDRFSIRQSSGTLIFASGDATGKNYSFQTGLTTLGTDLPYAFTVAGWNNAGADMHGLVLDVTNNFASGANSMVMEVRYLTVNKFVVAKTGFVGIGTGTTTPVSMLELGSSDLGNGAAGPVITLGRNTNATATGAGSINFQSKAGVAGFVWQDNAGNLRIHTAAPTNANDTAGVVVGTQTSTRETKQDIHDYTDYKSALSMVLDAPLHTFRYIKEVQGYGSNSPLAKIRIGYIADEVNPAFMVGNSIDQVSVNGLLMASIKALDLKIEEMEANAIGANTGSLADTLGQYANTFFSNALQKVENGVAYMKGIVTETLTTKELCLEDICINKAQLKELLEKNNISEPPEPTPEPTPVPEPDSEFTPEPEPTPEPAPEPVPESTPTTEAEPTL